MYILPEIFISLSTLILLLLTSFYKKFNQKDMAYLALFIIFFAQFFILKDIFYYEEIFNGFFIVDSFSSFIKLLILVCAGLIIYFYIVVKNPISLNRSEFPILVLFAVVGMMLMVSANNFLSLFMSIELQSLTLYILVSFSRKDSFSSEAGVKYFIIGSLSTCIFLFGTSLIYGLVGSVSFENISIFMSEQLTMPTFLIVGLIFILVSISLKISAAPFHMWTPDVYQGAPTLVTTILSTIPKIAAFGVLIRLLVYPFSEIIIDWGKILIILSITSMLVGSLGALLQSDLKRLMAYSTINHIGFMLMALVPGTEDGITAICIYLIFYVTMNLGVFLFILNMNRDQINVSSIKDLSGLYRSQPLMATFMAILLFSMAGVPPMAGFIGKLIILNLVIDNNLFYLAIIAVLTSVIADYIRLIKCIFFDQPQDELDIISNNQSKYLLGFFAIFNILVIFVPQFFLDLCSSVTLSLFALN